MSGVTLVFEAWDRAKAAEVAARLQEAGLQVQNATDLAAVLPDGRSSGSPSSAAAVIVLWSVTSRSLAAIRRAAADALSRGRLVSVAIDRIKPPQPFAKLPFVDMAATKASNARDTISGLVNAVLAVAGPRTLTSNSLLTPDEAQRWERLDQNATPDKLERFSRDFPNSQVAPVARERAAQMLAWRGIDFGKLEKESDFSPLAIAGALVVAAVIAGVVWYNWERLFQTSYDYQYGVPSDPNYSPTYPPAEPPPPLYVPAPAEPPPVYEPAPAPPDASVYDPLPPLDAPSADSPSTPVGSGGACLGSDQLSCELELGCAWLNSIQICVQSAPPPP